MKLNEKQAFKVLDEILNWACPNDRDKEAEADFVMLQLINLELGEKTMKWKCNTYDCQYEFENDITEEEIETGDFTKVICPKCKDKYNGCYRI